MTKLTNYFLILCVFLGLSVLLARHKKLPNFSQINSQLQKLISGENGNVVLKDIYQTGIIFKSYFIRVKVFDEVKTPEELVFSIDKENWLKMKSKIDRSLVTIFYDTTISYEPIPPGLNYPNNPSIGKWIEVQGQKKVWHFHKPYQYLENEVSWVESPLSLDTYEKFKNYGEKINDHHDPYFFEDEKAQISPKDQKETISNFLKSLISFDPLF